MSVATVIQLPLQQIVLFTELGNIIVVIVTNPMFILPWVLEKFTVKFTMSSVDGPTIYIHIGWVFGFTVTL